MEVRGHILPPGTYSPAGGAAGRLQELRERQRGLRQALGLRLRELRRLCLQEAELTGKLPPEYPLEPGERPQPPPRRRSGGPPRGPPPEVCRARREAQAQVCRARREAQAQVQVQAQVLEAARRLASVPGLPPEQRRRRQRLQAEAAQRLRQLRAQLGPPGQDENGSLCDLPALENGESPAPPKPPRADLGRPSPPRAGSSSPDRRPPPWTPDVPPGRRSSLASPASPARTLPRSASSFEGRSVPATPVLARSPRGPPLCRPEAPGLPPRPWSGSQDSQLGGPPAPGPPPPGAPRTRRSNSSEALIDWGGTPGDPPEASRGRGGGSGGPGGRPPLGGAAAQPEVAGAGGAAGLVPAAHRDPPRAPPGTPPRRRAPPGRPPRAAGTPPGLPHSLSYAGALAPRASGDTPGATPPPPPGPAAPRDPRVTPKPNPGHGEGSPRFPGGVVPKFGGGEIPKIAAPPRPLLASGRFWGGPVARPPRGGVWRGWGGRGGSHFGVQYRDLLPPAVSVSFLGETPQVWGSGVPTELL